MSRPERDIEKTYSLPDFVSKLRRLADALEQGERFDIQIAGERFGFLRGQFITSSTNAQTRRKKLNSRLNGCIHHKAEGQKSTLTIPDAISAAALAA